MTWVKAANFMKMLIKLSMEHKKITMTYSTRIEMTHCVNPKRNAGSTFAGLKFPYLSRAPLNMWGWFTEYFIMAMPLLVSGSTSMCMSTVEIILGTITMNSVLSKSLNLSSEYIW